MFEYHAELDAAEDATPSPLGSVARFVTLFVTVALFATGALFLAGIIG